jgi:hypothetical protein
MSHLRFGGAHEAPDPWRPGGLILLRPLQRLSAAAARANPSHDPPFDPGILPKALQVIAHAKDVSHPDNYRVFPRAATRQVSTTRPSRLITTSSCKLLTTHT